METTNNPIKIYFETGKKRTVAGALEWPVWEGPRGGKRWGPRYFMCRVAWHVKLKTE